MALRWSVWRSHTLGGKAAIAAAVAVLSTPSPSRCEEKYPLHPPRYPFWVKSILHAHEIPSVRRGYEVYTQVCSVCHSMNQLHFRHLALVLYPEKRVKQIAAEWNIVDGPDDQGKMYTRPGIPADAFPPPFPNEEAARWVNNGALPPDLSVYTTAKHEGMDYIFALILAYHDPPAGVRARYGLHYNPYYPGGFIAMPPPLHADLVDWEDGTPCTKSQMAKDVVNFLCWAAEPAHDERKLMGLKALSALILGVGLCSVWYRSMWIGFKTRRIDFTRAVM